MRWVARRTSLSFALKPKIKSEMIIKNAFLSLFSLFFCKWKTKSEQMISKDCERLFFESPFSSRVELLWQRRLLVCIKQSESSVSSVFLPSPPEHKKFSLLAEARECVQPRSIVRCVDCAGCCESFSSLTSFCLSIASVYWISRMVLSVSLLHFNTNFYDFCFAFRIA